MSRSDRAAKRARHGTSRPGSTALRTVAAVTAGIVGFAIVYGVTNVELLQHSVTTRSIDDLVGGSTPTETATSSASPTATVAANPTDPKAGKDINILLIGSDSRAGKTNSKIGGYVSGMRSDTTIIMHISADRSRIDFLSIPRDMRVTIPTCSFFNGKTIRGWTGKFNVAFANGGSHGNESEGAACTMKTVQNLTGIKFDHYAVIDFAGFEKMISAVHGVPMCVPHAIDDRRSGLHLKAGAQVLSGKNALAFARVRHIGDGTDLQRIKRQQELIDNLAKKVLGMNVLTSVPQLTQLLKAAGQSMTMDPKLGSFTYLAGLGYSLRNINQDNMNFMTVPWMYAGDKSGDVLATADAKIVYKRIKNDIPMNGGKSQPVATSPSPGATDGSSTSPTPVRQTQKEILAACKGA